MSLFQEISSYVKAQENSDDFETAFSTYLSEAEWGWELVKDFVLKVPKNAQILELGAGPKILSAKIASLHYQVTALEPSQPGFSIMKELGDSVDSFSILHSIHFASSDSTGEDFNEFEKYDLAFSINVMEHVSSVEKTLDNVVASLKNGGLYVFICPNYSFPFEPHFSSITLINKKLTDRYLKDRVTLKAKDAQHAVDLWDSLNWISARQIFAWAAQRSDIRVKISRRSLNMYLSRTIGGKEFKSRHPFISKVSRLLAPIANLIPISIVPVIEVRIQKLANSA